MNAKYFFITLLSLVFFQNCVMQYATKQFLNFDPSSRHKRLEYEVSNAVTFFGMVFFNGKLSIGKYPSIKNSLNDMKTKAACEDFINIDIEYYDNNFYLFGIPTLLIRADCVKGDKNQNEKVE